MEKKYYVSILVLVFVIGIISGCGFRLKGYESFAYLSGGEGRDLPKKIIWLGSKNQGPYEAEQLRLFEDMALKIISGSKQVIISQHQELSDQSLVFDEKAARFRVPDKVRAIGEEKGAAAVAQLTLIGPTVDLKRKGIWPFRKTKMIVGVGVRAVMVDFFTETVLLNVIERAEVQFYYDPIAEEDPTLYQEALDKSMKGLTKKIARSIVDASRESSWLTRISEVRDQVITIPAGRLQGIKLGQKFAVYEKTEEIKAYDGRSYPVWGKRKGLLKAKEVLEEKSNLEVVSGEGFEKGNILRLVP